MISADILTVSKLIKESDHVKTIHLSLLLLVSSFAFGGHDVREACMIGNDTIQYNSNIIVANNHISSFDDYAIEVAYERVIAWFENNNLKTDVKFTIKFQNAVNFPFVNGEVVNAYAITCASNNIILMTNWDSILANPKQIFKQKSTIEHHISVLVHEMTHVLVKHNASDELKMTTASQEMWAYTVQLDTMHPGFVAIAEQLYPEPKYSFDVTEQINTFVYSIDPDGFGISAYRWYKEHGTRDMMLALEQQWYPDTND